MKHMLILLLLFWDNVEITLTHGECSQLPSVDRAFVPDEYKKVQYQTGDVIYFSCDPGYTTGFNTTYICTENGWKAATYGQCVEKGTFPQLLGCTPPPALQNGHALKNSSYFYVNGDNVTYQCDHLYNLKGRPYKTCSNGQWLGDVQCLIISCGHPGDVQFADFSLVKGTDYEFGSQVQYTCHTGYQMTNSTSTLNCLQGGWDGHLPECEPEFSCELPAPNPNVRILGVDGGRVAAGNRITVQCVTGGRSEQVECLPSGTWGSTFPTCRGCTLQSFKQSDIYNENFDLSGLKASYNRGDVVRVRCKVGYRGFFKLICGNGEWHNTGDKCRIISCGHPGDVQFADFSLVKGTDYDFGSQVQYTCHTGYQMISYTSTRNCLQGGWDGHLPECERPLP